jgi:transposase
MRPTVASQVVREYLYAYASVCPFDGDLEAFVAPGVDADIMSLFLKQVSERYVDEHVVMILDQAGWHKARRLKKPPNITLYWLPPYSPELNPVEHLWDDIREKWFHNRLFASIEGVEDQLVGALAYLSGSPSLVRSLTLFAWMDN